MTVGLPSSLSDHPSLVGIVRFPKCTYTTNLVGIPNVIKDQNGTFMNLTQKVDMAENITGEEKLSPPITVSKSKVTDMYPYTYYVLTDGECEPLIMQPQYLPSSFTIKGVFALSHQPVERYFPSMYKGDTTGRVYNITNFNQMMLPTATNNGLQYMNANANTIMQNRKTQISDNVISAVSNIGTMITNPIKGITNLATNGISGLNTLKNIDARNKDSINTPSTISSFGTPSTRNIFKTDDVRILKYTIADNVKNKIENFVNRYGNKYNNYGVVNHKTYKGYIKFINPDIDGGIDFMHLQKIISILERGIFIE